MNIRNRNLLEIHLAVLLFGLSGLFGKALSLPAAIIVLGRVFFASLFLYGVLHYLNKPLRLNRRGDYLWLSLTGLLLAVHWSTFFLSIQLSSVATGLLMFSTFPIFVTFLEPYLFKEKIKTSAIITAAVAFLGTLLVIPQFELNNTVTAGSLWGIFSGFTYALLSMLNRKYAVNYSGSTVAFYEQCSAFLFLLPTYFIQQPILKADDILLLLLLGVLFTGIAHSLFINGLTHIRTQTAGIISCLEPVYGILFAALLLKEIPSLREILGGAIILSTVFYTTVQSRQSQS